MQITVNKNGTELTICPSGRVDTTTAPQLQEAVNENIVGVTDLIFDFAKLHYISSAGLRVILSAQKMMNAQGKMTVRGVNETIGEIFEVTGFSDILTIE